MLPTHEHAHLTLESTYRDVKNMLRDKNIKKLDMIPVVDHHSTMALVGSVHRSFPPFYSATAAAAAAAAAVSLSSPHHAFIFLLHDQG